MVRSRGSRHIETSVVVPQQEKEEEEKKKKKKKTREGVGPRLWQTAPLQATKTPSASLWIC